MADEMKELSLRIERIEKAIESISPQRSAKAADLSTDEIAAFKKVRDVVAADFGEFCGINDCFRCIIVRCQTACVQICDTICSPCDVECSCGPCNPGGLRGRVGRFGGLG